MTAPYQPVLEVTRGRIVELVHFGAAAVVDSTGHLLAWLGDPQLVTYLRSSAKPFQALPFIERGGDQAFHLTSKEIAIICASHDGTDEQVEVVKGIQAKVGVQESDLLCGTHPLSHGPTVEAMRARGEVPTANRHNCSGKHTGMLAHARMRGLPIADYINLEHPVQQTILETLGRDVRSAGRAGGAGHRRLFRTQLCHTRCTMPPSALPACVTRVDWQRSAPPPAGASPSR